MQEAPDWTQPVVKAQCWKRKKQVVRLLGHRAQRCLAKRSAATGTTENDRSGVDRRLQQGRA